MSLPGENAFSPAPRRTMQRNESSRDNVSMVSPSERHSGLVIALSFSGRSITTVAISSARSIRMDGSATSPPLILNAACVVQSGSMHAKCIEPE
ncbi:hypothetical protein BRPE64_DCDS04050 (plasmid) [Caballeronia insecticola]|uniref:Uncharacterized protein n=1 Tax=Caballeronia insecticola TaxID=758793 RepID=R4X3D7_9BURK|nr:hypothetical protein BRPE64_DCDS04050 [Caballeronia insecticola]